MTWQIIMADDPDSTGEKTSTATWTETEGKAFIYAARGEATIEALNVFVAAAIAARNAWQAKNTAIAAVEANVLTKINAADPQAGG